MPVSFIFRKMIGLRAGSCLVGIFTLAFLVTRSGLCAVNAPTDTAGKTTTNAAGVHTFTNSQGASFTAFILGVQGDQVTLRRADGQVFKVDIVIFNADDQAFIREWVANSTAKAPASSIAPVAATKAAPAKAKISGTGMVTYDIASVVERAGASVPQGEFAIALKVVPITSPLRDKTIIAIASGGRHWLACCGDGTLVAWGDNLADQLGLGQNAAAIPQTVLQGSRADMRLTQASSQRHVATVPEPALVDTSFGPKGKVIKIAAAANSSFALTAEGLLYEWGSEGGTFKSDKPIRRAGSADLKITDLAVADEDTGSFWALQSDGTILAWGSNSAGQLGVKVNAPEMTTSGMMRRPAPQVGSPTPVDASGVLQGKVVTMIAPQLALCSDGTLIQWGGVSVEPRVLANTTEVLKDKTITALATTPMYRTMMIGPSRYNSARRVLVLCADGTLAAWSGSLEPQAPSPPSPYRGRGPMDNTSPVADDTPQRPLFINTAEALNGKTVTDICNFSTGFLLLCADSTLVYWSGNGPPVAINMAALEGKIVTAIAPKILLTKEEKKLNWGL